MGSFNTTCFASNQTIATGDKCRVLPIVQQSTYNPVEVNSDGKTEHLYGIANSTCYPDCFWKPAGAWMPAVYEDCGVFKLQLDALTRDKLLTFFLDVFRDCPQVRQGENGSHDLPFNFPAFLREKAPGILQIVSSVHPYAQSATVEDESLDEELTDCWDYVFEVASENRLFIRDDSDKLRPVQFAVVHERAYARLIDSMSEFKNWSGESYEPVSFMNRVFDSATATAEKYLAISKASEPDEAEGHSMKDFYFADGWRSGLSSLDAGNSYPRGLEADATSTLSRDFAAGIITKEEFFEQFMPFLVDRYVLAGLNSMNLRFSPMVYAGQDYDNSLGAGYAKFVASVSRLVTKDRKTHQYGEYLRYSMQAPTREAFEGLVTELGQSDSDAGDIEFEAVAGTSEVNVTFSSPSDLEHMVEVIGRLAHPALMLDTLQAL